MKKILLATCLALPAAASHAETFELFRKGAWTVEYSVGDQGGVWCSASNRDLNEGFGFEIVTFDDGMVVASLYDNRESWSEEGNIALRVDDYGVWRAPAKSFGQLVVVDAPTRGFLTEFWQGRNLYIDTNLDGDWDYRFSLRGSAAALAALGDCRRKIGGTAS